jgi:cytochrome c-type biogenesis protein CcmI
MSLLLGAALFATAVVLFILQPMLTGRWAPMDRDDDEMTDAEARRRVTLLALRDVEYDRVTGKLDERDYHELRRELSAEALAALAAEREERSAQNRVAGGTHAEPASNAADIERQVRRVRQGLQVGTTCRICGHVNPEQSRFCSSCGTRLSEGATEERTGA